MLPEDEDSFVKYWVQVRYQPYCTVWGPPPMEEIQCNNSDPKVFFFTFLSLFNWFLHFRICPFNGIVQIFLRYLLLEHISVSQFTVSFNPFYCRVLASAWSPSSASLQTSPGTNYNYYYIVINKYFKQ